MIDFMITQYLFSDSREYSPGELTNIRIALVNNKFLAYLAIKHEFFQYLDYESPELFRYLNDYLKITNLSSPWDESFNEAVETDNIFEEDIPKSIADIFESVAGAVYLDSECSMDVAWSVFHKFFAPYLGKTNLLISCYFFLFN